MPRKLYDYIHGDPVEQVSKRWVVILMTMLTAEQSLAERFSVVREHFGLSARAMSLQIGIAQNNWFQYELGRKDPSTETLRRLANLGINIDWLIAGRGSMFVDKRPIVSSSEGDGFKSILESLDLVLKAQDSKRFELWSSIVSALSRSADGLTLAKLSTNLGIQPTEEWLLEQLSFLQQEGVIGYAKGTFRLIQSSKSVDASNGEIHGLLAVRDLLGTIIPALRQGVGRGRLMRIAEMPASGAVVDRLNDLINQIRRLNSEALSQPKQKGTRTFRLVFASLVTE